MIINKFYPILLPIAIQLILSSKLSFKKLIINGLNAVFLKQKDYIFFQSLFKMQFPKSEFGTNRILDCGRIIMVL